MYFLDIVGVFVFQCHTVSVTTALFADVLKLEVFPNTSLSRWSSIESRNGAIYWEATELSENIVFMETENNILWYSFNEEIPLISAFYLPTIETSGN